MKEAGGGTEARPTDSSSGTDHILFLKTKGWGGGREPNHRPPASLRTLTLSGVFCELLKIKSKGNVWT